MFTSGTVATITGTHSPVEGAWVRVVEAAPDGYVVRLLGFDATFTIGGGYLRAVPPVVTLRVNNIE